MLFSWSSFAHAETRITRPTSTKLAQTHKTRAGTLVTSMMISTRSPYVARNPRPHPGAEYVSSKRLVRDPRAQACVIKSNGWPIPARRCVASIRSRRPAHHALDHGTESKRFSTFNEPRALDGFEHPRSGGPLDFRDCTRCLCLHESDLRGVLPRSRYYIAMASSPIWIVSSDGATGTNARCLTERTAPCLA